MSTLRSAVREYLAMRRSLGFQLRDTGRLLLKVVTFMEARRASTVTTRLALTWAQHAQTVQLAETAHRLGTAFVTVIWVDDGYGSIRWKQESRFGRTFGVGFGNPDFPRLAEAFGLACFPIARADDFADALEQALQSAGRPVTFYRYPGTGHWFFESNRPQAYNQAAASLAWDRTLAFLKRSSTL
jgi:hypothetical protein